MKKLLSSLLVLTLTLSCGAPCFASNNDESDQAKTRSSAQEKENDMCSEELKTTIDKINELKSMSKGSYYWYRCKQILKSLLLMWALFILPSYFCYKEGREDERKTNEYLLKPKLSVEYAKGETNGFSDGFSKGHTSGYEMGFAFGKIFYSDDSTPSERKMFLDFTKNILSKSFLDRIKNLNQSELLKVFDNIYLATANLEGCLKYGNCDSNEVNKFFANNRLIP